MKFCITFISLIMIFVYGQVKEDKFPLVLNIILFALICIISFLWEYSIFNKNFESYFKIRNIDKKIGGFFLVYAIFWTTLLFFQDNSNQSAFYSILLLWTFAVTEIIFHFIYKMKKPYTIFIKGNELILNNLWTQKRNLVDLKQIRFDRFDKNLILDFKSKFKISIKTTDYNSDDIKKLLEIMIEKSEHNVFVPNNYLNQKRTAYKIKK
jgi:hypothetical protein